MDHSLGPKSGGVNPREMGDNTPTFLLIKLIIYQPMLNTKYLKLEILTFLKLKDKILNDV